MSGKYTDQPPIPMWFHQANLSSGYHETIPFHIAKVARKLGVYHQLFAGGVDSLYAVQVIEEADPLLGHMAGHILVRAQGHEV